MKTSVDAPGFLNTIGCIVSLPQFVALVAKFPFQEFHLLVEVRAKSSLLQHVVHVVKLLLEGFNLLNVMCINISPFFAFWEGTYIARGYDSRRRAGHDQFLHDICCRYLLLLCLLRPLECLQTSPAFLNGKVMCLTKPHSSLTFFASGAAFFITAVYVKHFYRLQQQDYC
jgi:hypothetical protein